MKLKSLVLGLAVLAGSLFLGGKQVNAAVTNNSESIVHSGGMPVKIYNDSRCTQYSGKNLSNLVNAWAVFATSKVDDYLTYDLGGNQWVKSKDLRTVSSVDTDSIYFLAYSENKDIYLYQDALFYSPYGKLAKNINFWKINKVAFLDQSDSLVGLDLGNNQWVRSSDVTIIYRRLWFREGTDLYNTNGVKSGYINKTLDYKPELFTNSILKGATFTATPIFVI